jgi:hypothetical protein
MYIIVQPIYSSDILDIILYYIILIYIYSYSCINSIYIYFVPTLINYSHFPCSPPKQKKFEIVVFYRFQLYLIFYQCIMRFHAVNWLILSPLFGLRKSYIYRERFFQEEKYMTEFDAITLEKRIWLVFPATSAKSAQSRRRR